ncbi:MAG: T9SS type A sorting domain-containing protein [Chitinophagaceae bacterium]|nr:T9SS type A sorting domain-containing protein [Chitinophagaceae bacterium]
MKIFLPHSKPFISTLFLAAVFLLSSTAGFAQLRTWAGGTGGGKNWNSGGNWSGGSVPLPGEDIVFNTPGVIGFSTMPAADIAFHSITISTGEVTVEGTSGLTITIGGNPDTDFLISGGGAAFTIGTNINITIAAGSNANISGTLNINNGRTYNSAGLNTVTSVFGAIYNSGTLSTATAANLLLQDFSVYTHTQDGGTIPTATWSGASNCNITGLINTNIVSGDGQAFGNLMYNCAGMTGVITMSPTVTISGNLNIANTGSSRVEMSAGSITVGGELEVAGMFVISGTIDRTLTVNDNVIVTGAGNLNLCNGGAANTGTLNALSNITNFGAITENGSGKGVINFIGTAAQNFNEFGAFVNNIDVNINNAAGVTFTNTTTVSGILTLTNGILTIPINQTVTIAGGTAIGGTGFGAAKHIATAVDYGTGEKGFLRINNMAASTPYLVPVGNGTYYLPVTLTPANINGFDICVFNGMTENGEPNGIAYGAPAKLKIVDAVWTVNLISGAAGAGVTMTTGWPAALEGASFSLYTAAQIGIAHWDNPDWGACLGSGNNTANTATRNAITVFSPFGVGETPFLLPVKFSYLNAAKGNGYNTLYWKANCSSTGVDFSIERSTDGSNFSPIHSITASQARCSQPFDFMDYNNITGTVFYRIKATENTGQVTYSTIVKLTGKQTDMQLMAVLPNPVQSQARLEINAAGKDRVELLIVSVDGRIMQRSSVQLQAGLSVINLDIASLQPGIYMVKGVFGNGNTQTARFTKN